MVNEVTNRLILRGDPLDIKNFIKDNVVDGELDFTVGVRVTDRVVSRTTSVKTMEGLPFIDFITGYTPPLLWIERISNIWKNIQFELVWYVIETQEYGIKRIKFDDYNENMHYNIIEGDIEYNYENDTDEENDIDPIAEKSSGRFGKILASVGLSYEADY